MCTSTLETRVHQIHIFLSSDIKSNEKSIDPLLRFYELWGSFFIKQSILLTPFFPILFLRYLPRSPLPSLTSHPFFIPYSLFLSPPPLLPPPLAPPLLPPPQDSQRRDISEPLSWHRSPHQCRYKNQTSWYLDANPYGCFYIFWSITRCTVETNCKLLLFFFNHLMFLLFSSTYIAMFEVCRANL